MHVVATAGHVDHGKSTLVRALTGMEPDRWAEEHRRGMTIDLGGSQPTCWLGWGRSARRHSAKWSRSWSVVTGTLGGGRVRVGDELLLAPTMRPVRVRGLQSLGEPVEEATGVSRVAVNLRGVPVEEVSRGFALLTPAHWLMADVIDVRFRGGTAAAELPTTCTLHVGSAQTAIRVRPLGEDIARLSLPSPLPLRIGDRALLRDPGRHRIAAGVTILDVRPPLLRRRGAAAVRAAELATMDGQPDGAAELRRRLIIRAGDLAAMGAPPPAAPVAGDWLVEPGHWSELRERLSRLVAEHARTHPLEQGLPAETARQLLDLPDARLVHALLVPPLSLIDGRISQAAPSLPPALAQAVATLHAELADRPYLAPEAHRLAELGLESRELAAAVRTGALARVTDGIYLLPAALASVTDVLAGLPQPFTVSAAREALGTTRRVAVPLVELLDARGRTKRLPDSRRELLG